MGRALNLVGYYWALTPIRLIIFPLLIVGFIGFVIANCHFQTPAEAIDHARFSPPTYTCLSGRHGSLNCSPYPAVASIASKSEVLDEFWEKYLPIAHIGVVFCLAYLALPYFRHGKSINEKVTSLIGTGYDERKAFRENIRKFPHDEYEQWPELVVTLNISLMLEARETPNGETLQEAKKDFKVIVKTECVSKDWVRRRLMHTYLVGGDIITVSFGILFAFVLHYLAFVGQIHPLTISSILGNPWCQAAVGLGLLIWTCFVPIYYGICSAVLNGSISQLFAEASSQRRKVEALTKLYAGNKIALEHEGQSKTNVFVEPRPKGGPEGSPINDYVVESVEDLVLHTTHTREAAIKWATDNGYTPHVARVRHLNDKKNPDHWRKV